MANLDIRDRQLALADGVYPVLHMPGTPGNIDTGRLTRKRSLLAITEELALSIAEARLMTRATSFLIPNFSVVDLKCSNFLANQYYCAKPFYF